MSCYCLASSYPPCSWCENNYSCARCESITPVDGDEFAVRLLICSDCLDDRIDQMKDSLGEFLVHDDEDIRELAKKILKDTK